MRLDKLRLALELAERLHDLVDELDELPRGHVIQSAQYLRDLIAYELGREEVRRINALRRCTTSA
jgi:hypothetical protein